MIFYNLKIIHQFAGILFLQMVQRNVYNGDSCIEISALVQTCTLKSLVAKCMITVR